MEFSTWGRVSILFALLAACGGNDSGVSTVAVPTTHDPAGPFVANGSPGFFAATAGSAHDFAATYGNGGPFEANGASGPFAQTGSFESDCANACARAASYPCIVVNQQQATPQQGNGASSGTSSSNGNQGDNCVSDCAQLDAYKGTCLGNIIANFIACALTAPLSCDSHGKVQVENCGEPDFTPCGLTVKQTPPDQTNTGPAVVDAGR
jgi:hypothetical protein